MKSLRFHLNKEDGLKILYAFLWSLASTSVVALIALVQTAQFPPEILFVVPFINTILYGLKKWIDGKVSK